MIAAELEAALAARGWVTIDLPDPSPVFAARERLLERLRVAALPGLRCLDDYHLLMADGEQHVDVLHGLATFYWDAER